MATLNFDPNSVEDDRGPAPIPAGRYLLEIVDTQSIDNKKGTGKYLFLIMRVVEGQYEGRKVFDRINYINTSEQAQQIARKQLKRLCGLCGVTGDLVDSEQLHFRRFYANVVVKPDEGYGQQNEVKYPAATIQQEAREQGQEEIPFDATPESASVKQNGGNPAKPAAAAAFSPLVRPNVARPAPTGTAKPWDKKPKF
jgi:hypothetical protein